ncbi:MAG: DinB family protein [Anaerolineae bacterium]|nr:DinB family protein [Anaerolineae bacterium]
MTDNILNWSKSILAISPARWLRLVQSVPMELLSMRPAENEWSAIECLQHVVDVERTSFPTRIKALLAEQPFAGFNPSDQPPKPAPTITLANEFNQLRQETLALFNQITEANLDNQSLHAEYGMVTMRQLVHHMAGHDLNHLVQAERALMQPFIQGCGPWVVNYEDHIAK